MLFKPTQPKLYAEHSREKCKLDIESALVHVLVQIDLEHPLLFC